MLSSIRELRAQVESKVGVAEANRQKEALDFLDELEAKVKSFCFKGENDEPTLEFLRVKS
ncbi:MAG: hypothetical protein Q8N52_12090 [Acidobacteriota bacterium]|nr:hypothetical protein [Acidobacteriota bacterium]